MALAGCERGVADANERVHRYASIGHLLDTVQPHAHGGKGDGKCGRVRAFGVPALDSRIRNEPIVAAAPPVLAAGVPPAGDVALIGILDVNSQAVEGNIAILGPVEKVFVAIGDETRELSGLKWPTENVSPTSVSTVIDLIQCSVFCSTNNSLRRSASWWGIIRFFDTAPTFRRSRSVSARVTVLSPNVAHPKLGGDRGNHQTSLMAHAG